MLKYFNRMRKSILVCFIMILCFLVVDADNKNNSNKIKKLYNKGQYSLVCKLYEGYVNEKLSYSDFILIGDSYFYTEQYSKASEIYNKCILLNKHEFLNSENIERFFNSLFRSRNYEAIKSLYNKNKDVLSDNYKIKNIAASAGLIAEEANRGSGKYNKANELVIEDLCLSYGLGVVCDNPVYYTYMSKETYSAVSSEKGYNYMPETLSKLKYMNGIQPKMLESYTDIDSKYFKLVSELNERLKKYFVSNYAVCPSGEYVVFTDFSSLKSHVGLSFIEKKNGEWGKVKTLNFCKSNYDYGMPVFSNNGDVLYFISNKSGGFGGWDIYYSEKSDNGKWGNPKNLGSMINTPGDEMYPYIATSGILYFSSDGHPGYGGFDIFMAERNEGTTIVKNLVAVNSKDDDISCVYNLKHDKLFVLSRFIEDNEARSTLKKYSVSQITELDNRYAKRIEILDFYSNPEIYDMLNSGIKQVFLDMPEKLGYIHARGTITGRKSKSVLALNSEIPLERNNISNQDRKGLLKDTTDNSAHKSSAVINSVVYFDFDSYKLKETGKKTLKELFGEVKNIRNCVFNIVGYADTTGNEKYNLWLSEKRAECIGAYLISAFNVKQRNIYITARGEYLSFSNRDKCRRVDINTNNNGIIGYNLRVSYVSPIDLSIEKLAGLFNIKARIIRELNATNCDEGIIKKGSLITIPVKALHKVRKGETLRAVVNRYLLEGDKLLEVNSLSNENKLSKIRVLYVPYGVNDEVMPYGFVKKEK